MQSKKMIPNLQAWPLLFHKLLISHQVFENNENHISIIDIFDSKFDAFEDMMVKFYNVGLMDDYECSGGEFCPFDYGNLNIEDSD